MTPIRLNRRRFLGCSAAAGIALAQGDVASAGEPSRPLRLGLIGLGNRGTTLLRTAIELPGIEIAAVCDSENKHRLRALGILEKAQRPRPEATDNIEGVLNRADVEAVLVALPCDVHADTYVSALQAGKHLYAEKPLGLSGPDCDRVIAESSLHTELRVHVGLQRRSNPRYQAAIDLVRRGDLGRLLECRAAWASSNGPVNGHGGWLASRARSGDWMVEQAVHVWDVLHWVADGPPARAFGQGRRDVFRHLQPDRDVTDHYSVMLEWPSGFHANFVHSWVDPADDAFTGVSQRLVGTSGGLDLGTGVVTFRGKGRSRQTLHPGNQPETRLALATFASAVRGEATAPPVSLTEARDATLTALLVRKAVDERRVVTWDEIQGESATA
jgi:predicted dehydrogenase